MDGGLRSVSRRTIDALGQRAAALAVAAVLPLTTALAAPPSAVDDSSDAKVGTAHHRQQGKFAPFGRSGKLRARVVGSDGATISVRVLARLFGDSARSAGPFQTLRDSATGRTLSLIGLRPFASKVGGSVGGYRVGLWPEKAGRRRSDAYANPEGFIEVTQQTQDTRVSEYFRLRDFLTHDQGDVWPKYLVLRDDLVDKLELVLSDLAAHGYSIVHPVIVSGFRTPQYNSLGVGSRGGRARDSRHQYGDAADLAVQVDPCSGRVCRRDRRRRLMVTGAVLAAVERVEAAHPDLVGGTGIYRATRTHGPFVHIDVRGIRARWGHT
ncbi:MAG: hypothetical protein NVS4B3_24670 [Gemmatimonadaceae bacterium]